MRPVEIMTRDNDEGQESRVYCGKDDSLDIFARAPRKYRRIFPNSLFLVFNSGGSKANLSGDSGGGFSTAFLLYLIESPDS
jgi:hypothetical protein